MIPINEFQLKSDILFSPSSLEGTFTVFSFETPFYETLMLSIDCHLAFVDLGSATVVYKQFKEEYLNWIKQNLPMQYEFIQSKLNGEIEETEGEEVLYRSYPFQIIKEEGWYEIRIEDYQAQEHQDLYLWFCGLIQELESIWEMESDRNE